MTPTKDPFLPDSLQNMLSTFLKQYGVSGLEKALHSYADMQQEYICKTKSSFSKIRLTDIYYLEIQGHSIVVHTQYGTYQKYGSLKKEGKLLSSYGFIKCNQSCLVSLRKIRSIHNNDIILINDAQLHMSQHYAPQVLIAFSRNGFSI